MIEPIPSASNSATATTTITPTPSSTPSAAPSTDGYVERTPCPDQPTAIAQEYGHLPRGPRGVAVALRRHVGTKSSADLTEELLLVSLDDPTKVVRLTDCVLAVRYLGGVATESGVDVYFNEAAPRGGEDGGQKVDLVRLRLPAGTRTVLFSYQSGHGALTPTCCGASLRAGRYFAYYNDSGLRIRDLQTQEDRLLFRHGTGCKSPFGPDETTECYGNADPVWSSDGQYVVFMREFWEWTSWWIMPADGSSRPRRLQAPDAAIRWNAVTARDCAVTRRSDAEAPKSGYSLSGCAFDSSGRSLHRFVWDSQVPPPEREYSFLQLRGADDRAVWLTGSGLYINTWTRDGTAVVVSEMNGAGDWSRHSWRFFLMDMAGTTTPIAIPASDVLMLLPR
ncbi:MAG: hypothetical protein WCI61_00605 [Chloroflexota bacterium]